MHQQQIGQLAPAAWELQTFVLLACLLLMLLCLPMLSHSPAVVPRQCNLCCCSRGNKLEQKHRGLHLQQSPLMHPKQQHQQQQQWCVTVIGF
jgi:hypothetical protein